MIARVEDLQFRVQSLVTRFAQRNPHVTVMLTWVFPSWSTTLDIFQISAPVILRMLFLTYPIITTFAFEAFSCHVFEGAASFLAADVTVICSSSVPGYEYVSADHERIKSIAWLAVIVYPVGLMVVVWLLLLNARTAIKEKRPTRLSIALAFLHREYEPALYFWEVCEML